MGMVLAKYKEKNWTLAKGLLKSNKVKIIVKLRSVEKMQRGIKKSYNEPF